MRLHKVLYSKKGPFVIPLPKNLQTPRKSRAPPTPSTWQSSPPSSVSSSPTKPVSDELEQVYKVRFLLRIVHYLIKENSRPSNYAIPHDYIHMILPKTHSVFI